MTQIGRTVSVLATLLAIAFPVTAYAWQQTAAGHVTYYEVGWSGDTIEVGLDVPVVNPGGCNHTAYIVVGGASGDSYYKAAEAALLAAYVSGKPVVITIDGCFNLGNGATYPHIIGVRFGNPT